MRTLCSVFALVLVCLGVSCGGGSGDDGGKVKVVAITTQIGDFARNVGGDNIALTVLLKPNQDAHDFEPQPSQIRSLQDAAVILSNGLGLDEFVEKAVRDKSKLVEVTEGVTPADSHGESDPHVWFSVPNAKIMVTNIRDALVAADSANATAYEANAASYTAQLDELDAQIRRDVATLPANCRKLVTNHDFLGNFAAAYGFTVVGSVIPSTTTQAEASAADVAAIVRQIRAEGVTAVFAEISVNPALMAQVGREAGVKVVDDLYSDSLGDKDSDGATYIEMMRANTSKIVGALKDCRV